MGKPVALIIGGGSGVGAEGYDIAILSSSGKGETLANELGGFGFTGSNLNPADLENFITQTHARYGRIDTLINCTGHGPKGDIMDISDDDWHLGMDYYFMNVVRATRMIVPIMQKQGAGLL